MCQTLHQVIPSHTLYILYNTYMGWKTHISHMFDPIFICSRYRRYLDEKSMKFLRYIHQIYSRKLWTSHQMSMQLSFVYVYFVFPPIIPHQMFFPPFLPGDE